MRGPAHRECEPDRQPGLEASPVSGGLLTPLASGRLRGTALAAATPSGAGTGGFTVGLTASLAGRPAPWRRLCTSGRRPGWRPGHRRLLGLVAPAIPPLLPFPRPAGESCELAGPAGFTARFLEPLARALQLVFGEPHLLAGDVGPQFGGAQGLFAGCFLC